MIAEPRHHPIPVRPRATYRRVRCQECRCLTERVYRFEHANRCRRCHLAAVQQAEAVEAAEHSYDRLRFGGGW